MDADLEIRLTRSGWHYRQLAVIPDADVSDAEVESDDPDDGTSIGLHGNNSDDESDWSTDSEDVPLAQFQRSTDPDDDDIPLSHLFHSSKADIDKCASTKGHIYRWCSVNQSVVDVTWKDTLPGGPDESDSPFDYFLQYFTLDMLQKIVKETNAYAVKKGWASE